MKKKAYMSPNTETYAIAIQQILDASVTTSGTANITTADEDDDIPNTADSRGILSIWNDEGI